MRVGFMTYDSKINFYNIKGALTQPQMMTVGDVNDMFVPLVDGLMCSVEESEAVIDSLMEQIPQMFGDTRETETILGPVIQAGKEAFKAAQCAGKLIVFHHNLPVAEAPGKLKNRDDRKVLGTEKEKTVLTPQNKTYNEFGQECVGVGCTVDLFLFNNAYIDVATLSQESPLQFLVTFHISSCIILYRSGLSAKWWSNVQVHLLSTRLRRRTILSRSSS